MMKKLLSTACFLSLLSAVPALAHEDHGKAQYGGVVAEAGMAQFEIVAKDGKVVVYATQHGAPLASTGASGKLTVLEGAKKSDIELKPAGDNRLEGKGSAGPGAKLLVNVQLLGQKPLQARAVMP